MVSLGTYLRYIFVPQDGTIGFDVLRAVVSTDEEGSVVMAGTTSLDFSGPSVGGTDFVAIKLDSGGTTLWTWQVVRFFCSVCLRSERVNSVGVGESYTWLWTNHK